jgi:hypothetical protein
MKWLGVLWKPYIGQAVGGKLDLMALIGGAEERAAKTKGQELGKYFPSEIVTRFSFIKVFTSNMLYAYFQNCTA